MRIIWHGHSCFEIKDSRTVIVDPHDGKSIGIKAPVVRGDLVLISHDHFDHNCSRIVKGDFDLINRQGEWVKRGLRIVGIETFHDSLKGAKRGANIIFTFEMDGVRFCHCGDLGHLLSDEQRGAIGEVDVLFVPVGGVFTIDGHQARQVVEQIRPRIAIPMHFRMGGLSLSIQTVEGFLEGIPKELVLRVGNEVDLYGEDLPKKTEYWVFSP